MNESQLRRLIRVRRIYEVTCDSPACNGNADEGSIYDSRSDADEARENHIRQHLDGQFSDEHDWRWKEFG